MLSFYKVFVYCRDYSIFYAEFANWKKINDLTKNDIIYCFTICGSHYHEYSTNILKLKDFKGEISIYQFKEEEIKIPKNKKIFCKPNFLNSYLFYYNNIEYKTILYLVASLYKENYLLIPERIAIKLQECSRYNYNFIYKNGKYIVKYKKELLERIFKYLDNNFWSFKFIYEIIHLNGSNKFYGDKNKFSILISLCKSNGIEYEICENCIEIFVINQQELKHKEDKYFEGKIYSYINDILLYIKIGRYVAFI